VTKNISIEGLSDPNGPPFFLKRLWVGFRLEEKVNDERRVFLLSANGRAIAYVM
jgi:hypothetical protein